MGSTAYAVSMPNHHGYSGNPAPTPRPMGVSRMNIWLIHFDQPIASFKRSSGVITSLVWAMASASADFAANSSA